MRLAAEAQRTDKLILHPFTSYMPLGRTCGEHRTVSRRLLIFMSAFWNRPYIRSHGGECAQLLWDPVGDPDQSRASIPHKDVRAEFMGSLRMQPRLLSVFQDAEKGHPLHLDPKRTRFEFRCHPRRSRVRTLWLREGNEYRHLIWCPLWCPFALDFGAIECNLLQLNIL
jgi:hypothetical protein